MSFERAYKNCRICYDTYEYMLLYIRESCLDTEPDMEPVHKAMNEAMKALEDHVRNIFPFWMESGYCKEEMELAQEALKACAECDFTNSCIADLLEPEVFKTQEEEEESK